MDPDSSGLPRPLYDALHREAQGLMRRYDVSERTVVSLLHQSENTMFLVRDPARPEPVVLRVHSQNLSYHSAPSIASELMWMQALRRDAGVIAPEPIPARDGSLVQLLSAPDLDKPRHAVIFSFLTGAEPPPETLIDNFERLGEITARMHRHARAWTVPRTFTRHAWDFDAAIGAHPLWGRWQDGMGVDPEALKILTRLAGVLKRRLERIGTAREYFGLIHADMRVANILVENDVTKVIDFDDCGLCWYIYDLATALSFLEEEPTVPALIAAWLKGYRKVMPLQREIEDEIPTFIMLRRLLEVAWLGTRRHLEFAQGLGAGFTAGSCRLAQDYLRRFG
ncbi:aminoglycoside phosphotransferase [Hypericibacter terrae]|uniref:Aminoglycoside phosphotransferase n=1 Tax=Hypericibacter terrae TaxID=2602015 RepID=A0A5J6MPL9_9PROT|nr:phosphotransferase [Hypericibacter terrae]QEX19097.1 aminoglycoside phosphotransferase [Hypericibacter terrae]